MSLEFSQQIENTLFSCNLHMYKYWDNLRHEHLGTQGHGEFYSLASIEGSSHSIGHQSGLQSDKQSFSVKFTPLDTL